jgi:hypothetical protein
MNRIQRLALCACFLTMTLVYAPAARADLITPVSASAESVWCCRPAVDTINGNGMTGLLHGAGSGTGSMWMAEANSLPSWIEWDLGADYLISGFRLWNYNETNNSDRGTKTATVSTSTNGVNYNAVSGFTNYEFTQAPGTVGYAGEDYFFSSDLFVQYLRLDITENWGDSDGYTGIAEFRALTAAVPEPASVALVLAGLTILALRRRAARASGGVRIS